MKHSIYFTDKVGLFDLFWPIKTASLFEGLNKRFSLTISVSESTDLIAEENEEPQTDAYSTTRTWF